MNVFDMNASVEPMFVLQNGNEILLHFTIEKASVAEAITCSVMTLRIQKGDIYSFMIWLAERRHLWASWRLMALQLGSQVAGRHIISLRSAEPSRSLKAFDIDYHKDMLHTDFVAEYNERTAVLAFHKFAMPEDLATFVELYLGDDKAFRWKVFETVCLLPPARLKALIDATVDKIQVSAERSHQPDPGATFH